MKKIILSLISFIIFMSCNMVAIYATEEDSQVQTKTTELVIEEGTYIITSAMNANLSFDVTRASMSSGANITLWQKNGQSNQRFNIKSDGSGYYTFEVVNSGKYLSALDSNNVVQSNYTGKDNQKWKISKTKDGYYYIISKKNNLYIDIHGKENRSGANVEIYTGHGEINQKFKFNKAQQVKGTKTIEDGRYIIKTALDEKKVIDITGALSTDKVNVEIWQNNKGKNQMFDIKYLDNGYYTIQAVHSKKLLTVANSGQTAPTNVEQYSDLNIDAQKWVIKDVGNGYYSIISKCNNLYLDIHGAQKANGANVEVYWGNGGLNQKFKIEKVEELKGTKTIENGRYIIKSALNENKAIDITGAVGANKANVEIWQSNNGNNQKFDIKYLDNGYYTIEAVHSGKLMTVANSNNTNCANVEQNKNQNLDSQKWIIKDAGDGYYNIISKSNELYLDIHGAIDKNGTNVEVYTGNNGKNQKFKFVKTEAIQTVSNANYIIISALNENKVLDIEQASTLDGGNLLLWQINYGNNQRFKLEYIKNGEYIIKNINSGKVLTVNKGNVEQKTLDNSDSQKWILQVADNGYYYIKSKSTGLYMDVANASTKDGTNIGLCSWNYGNAQKYKFDLKEFRGIDVSQYQGTIEWNKVANTGIDFAIMRIGLRGYRNANLKLDSMFETNYKGANENGIPVGVYFVTQALNYNEGVEEANFIIPTLKKCNITYPVVLDVEWAGGYEGNNGRADYISKEERTNAINGFCDTIKKAGYTPMVYANKDWLTNYMNVSDLRCDIWLAHYVSGAPAKKSDYKGDYTIWQYTSTGKVNGINGDVDLNIGYKKY